MSIVLNEIENKVLENELINQAIVESLGGDPQAIIKDIVKKTEKERWKKKNIDITDYNMNFGCATLLCLAAIPMICTTQYTIWGCALLFIVFYLIYEGFTGTRAVTNMPNKKISLTTSHLVNLKKEYDAPYLSEEITTQQLLLCADYFEKDPRKIHKDIKEKCSANLWRLNSQSSRLSSARIALSKESEENALGVLSQNRITLIDSQLSELSILIKAVENQKIESDRALKLVTDATDNIRQLVDALSITQYLEKTPEVINSANKSLDETSILLDKMLVASAKSVSSLEKISDAIDTLKKESILTS